MPLNVFTKAEKQAFRKRSLRRPGLVRVGLMRRHHPRSRKFQSPEYNSWAAMIRRCSPGGSKDYFGRGISVCEQWRSSFAQFSSDVGPRPTEHHSIGRINNNGNYEPGNVRWETREQQSNNKRNNLWLPLGDSVVSATQFSRLTGISYARACRMAWTEYVDRPARKRTESFDEPVFVKVNLSLTDIDLLASAPCDSFDISVDAYA